MSSTTIIKLSVLHGARDYYRSVCYILQLDDFKIMLDCGWDSRLSPNMCEVYQEQARSVDAILLSYPDISHCGALPYLLNKCGVSCPIYATTPTHNMGLMFMNDLWLSRFNSGITDDVISLEDIDYAFSKIEQVKYYQTLQIMGSISICPVPAGHMVGGSVWRILSGSSLVEPDEQIIYAVDFDHKKERHLTINVSHSLLNIDLTVFKTDEYPFLNIY